MSNDIYVKTLEAQNESLKEQLAQFEIKCERVSDKLQDICLRYNIDIKTGMPKETFLMKIKNKINISEYLPVIFTILIVATIIASVIYLCDVMEKHSYYMNNRISDIKNELLINVYKDENSMFADIRKVAINKGYAILNNKMYHKDGKELDNKECIECWETLRNEKIVERK